MSCFGDDPIDRHLDRKGDQMLEPEEKGGEDFGSDYQDIQVSEWRQSNSHRRTVRRNERKGA